MSPILSRVLKVFAIALVAALLTVLTQVGGVLYLAAIASQGWIERRISHPWKLRLAKLGYFMALYLVATLLIVPLLARPLGRAPLPMWGSGHLRPLRAFTCLLNRHYVRAELREATIAVADQMAARFPGTDLYYLDANFPFWDGFSLLPHRSHDDGKKLDLAFCYMDPATGETKNDSPSWLGYGVYADPKKGEQDQPAICGQGGHWQYSIMQSIVPQWSKDAFELDEARTKAMVELFAAQPAIAKMFIEPHLKARMDLSSPKIRYHGCQAARHDDHLHVQIR